MNEEAKESSVSKDMANGDRASVVIDQGLDNSEENSVNINMLMGTLINSSLGSINILSRHIWSESVVGDFPYIMSTMGAFSLVDPIIGGFKAGVAYVGRNHVGVQCGWLIAFANNSLGTVVYADCGPLSRFNIINWAQIEANLNQASYIAYVSDPMTGTSVYATVSGDASSGSVLTATFNG
ncbi:jasmonate-induced protein homolog [Beta vulgaris subsp. vulgaris]|uniref:jasmonate-induced protein homolog n=1 Tax=Beta vulgaris subsp. vulgaris TaxID=3555 RepID=UPI0020374158|nr:jasmonate-induced protein homolog [Beta vulgaris subsp. vulgaris]